MRDVALNGRNVVDLMKTIPGVISVGTVTSSTVNNVVGKRFEAFNVFNTDQFSTVNRTTNVTNAAGQTGANIFTNYTGLTVTNNTRPAGNTSVPGSFFGEYTGTRDRRIIQLGVEAAFLTREARSALPSAFPERRRVWHHQA